MKAYIISRDKMSSEVLERVLNEDDFVGIKTLPPTTESVQSLRDADVATVLFWDLDAKESPNLVKSCPVHVSVVFFGSHESIKAVGDGVRYALRKPFSKLQVRQVLQSSLLAGVKLHAKSQKNPDEQSADSIKKRWQTGLASINVRRNELIQMLKATPEQLRVLVQKRGSDLAGENRKLPAAAFPMSHALVVDPSEQNLRQMLHSFAAKCVLQADTSADGMAGWQQLQDGHYDVLVLRWESPELNGLSFYNKLRTNERFRYLPVVVLSSKVQTQDFRLLDEDLAVSLLPLPISDKALSGALSQVVSNAVLSREFINDLTKVIVDIQSVSDAAGKEILLPKGQAYDQVVANALKLVGDRLLDEHNFEGAEWAYSAAWRLGDRRLSLVTGYGKACLYQGRSDDALKLISVADAIAPKSVERLCLLGEIELGRRHYGDAKLQFGKALVIDPDSRRAEAGIKVAEALESFEKSGEAKAPTDNFAAYLNMIGITLSRAGKTTDAASYYEAAMNFVHKPDQQAKLWFNLGICYLRARRPGDAKVALEHAIKLSDGKMTKAQKFLAIASEATAKGSVASDAAFDFEVI
ncbi:MAG: response regulator [Deltaproteobacteria bacterium]|nr:response regulator [Deltaproteobacteria bacterium]